MNKTEFIAAVAENADISKKDAEKAIKAFADVVTEELKKGEEHLKFPRELQEREETRRQARL